MLRHLAIIFGFSFTVCFGQDQPLPRTFRSAAHEMLSSADLQQNLELSPVEIDRLKRFLSSSEVVAASRKREGTSIDGRGGTLESKPTPESNDDEQTLERLYRSEVERILHPEQLQELFAASMRLEFPNGLSPFENRRCLHICGITKEEQAKLAEYVAEQRKALSERSQTTIAMRAKRVLAALSDESKQLFVNYAGNSFAPSLNVDLNTKVNDIPYSSLIATCTSVELVLESEELQKQIKLNPEQFARLTALTNQSSDEFFKAARGGSGTQRLSEFYKDLRAKTFASMRKTLTDQQIFQVSQIRASILFAANFSDPFEQAALVVYLRIAPEDLVRVKRVAELEKAELRKDLNKLNEQVFEFLSAKLSEVPRARMSRLFDGVWQSSE